MALLDVIDPCKPSKQADLRRKSSSNNHSQMKSERVNAQPSNPTEKKSNNKYNDKPQFRRNSNTNYSRNNTSSGNNPLPTNYSIMAERKEIANDHNKPLAWLENKVKSDQKTRAQAMFDNGSGMNVIHTDLVKKLGLKVVEKPMVCNTINGKVTLNYLTEDFKVRLKLRPEDSDKEKWFEFTTNGQVSDAIPNTLLLGVKFMDKYGIYRRKDKGQKTEYLIIEGTNNIVKNISDQENPTVNTSEDIYYYLEVLNENEGLPIEDPNYIELPVEGIDIGKVEGIIENPTENETKL